MVMDNEKFIKINFKCNSEQMLRHIDNVLNVWQSFTKNMELIICINFFNPYLSTTYVLLIILFLIQILNI